MQRKRALALAVTLTTVTAAGGATAMAVTGALGLGPSPAGAEVGTSVPDTTATPDTLAPVVVYEDIPVPMTAADTAPRRPRPSRRPLTRRRCLGRLRPPAGPPARRGAPRSRPKTALARRRPPPSQPTITAAIGPTIATATTRAPMTIGRAMTTAGTAMTEAPATNRPDAERAVPRRKKAHPAASARAVTVGMSASAGLGIVAMLALAAPRTGAIGSTAVEPTSDPSAPAATAAATAPTIVVRRYVPVPATAAPTPTAGAAVPGPTSAAQGRRDAFDVAEAQGGEAGQPPRGRPPAPGPPRRRRLSPSRPLRPRRPPRPRRRS